MALIDVSATSILSEATSIYLDAANLGLKVPRHVNTKFRNKLASPQYRDMLGAAGLDSTLIGYLLGNKHRWDQGLCKYFTLRFLQFFMRRSPKSMSFNPDVLTAQYSLPSAKSHEILTAYDSQAYAAMFVMEGPAVFLANPRYITVKLKTQYPNVSKGAEEFQLRWINMRYTKDIKSGNVTLQPLPKFKAKRKDIGKSLETKGQIKNQAGQIANFSYCLLANAFKELCETALKMLVGDVIPSGSADVLVPFDLLNIILKRNSKFRIVTYSSTGALGPLFAHSPAERGISVSSEYRINGIEDIYVLFGSQNDVENVITFGYTQGAYAGSGFKLSAHNVYADVEDGEVYALLFKASRPGDIETSELVFWEDPVEITTYEILDENGILDTFGV